MSYYLRDRSDGQVEIVLFRTVQVGLYPNWSAAEDARTYLKDDQPELPDDRPVNFREARSDAAEAAALDLSELVPDEPKPVRKSVRGRSRNLPAVVSQPRAPAQAAPAVSHELTDDQLQQAFSRIQNGESLREIALDYGVSTFQLSGLWERHRRRMQKYMASAGQQPCRHCQRLFTPSISNPETCARCSK